MATSRKTKTKAKTKKKTTASRASKAKPAAKKTTSKKKVAAKKVTAKKATKKAPSKAAAPKSAAKTTKAKTGMKKKTATAKKTIAVAPKIEKPVKPRKSALEPSVLKTIRDALVHERQQKMSVMQNTQAQLADKDIALADVSDRASGGFEDELALGLMNIEAAQLDDIELAIQRIDEGTYGICVDCNKPIPRKRLDFLPIAQRCLNCEDSWERRARIAGRDRDDD